MNLKEKIGQMLHVGFNGLTAPDHILDWLARGQIGGVMLFARNVDTPEQVAGLVRQCREAAPRPILISIDQEGGRIARLRAGFSESPGAMALGAADSEALAEEVAEVMARELRALGINWVIAPVVDIAHNAENPAIGTRSLGTNPQRVSALALAQIRGFNRGGVAATAKHFPGHGNTPIDTHIALATIGGSMDDLWAHDLMPFRAAVEAGIDAVMVTHVMLNALDSQYPATISPPIIQNLLREKIGFRGLVCADGMEMKAISDHFGVGESAVLAALAGEDVIFFLHSRAFQEEAYAALLAAAHDGRLSEARIDESVSRIQSLAEKYRITDAPHLDVIRQPEHLAVMEKAARAGTVLLRADSDVFPIQAHDRAHGGAPLQKTALIEFASYLDTGAMERGDSTALATILHQRAPEIESIGLPSSGIAPETLERAKRLAIESDVIILATRNTHLWAEETQIARELMSLAKNVILVCLANPYDADALPGAGTILCTCGDSTPSLYAAVDALMGDFIPEGKLPVRVGS